MRKTRKYLLNLPLEDYERAKIVAELKGEPIATVMRSAIRYYLTSSEIRSLLKNTKIDSKAPESP